MKIAVASTGETMDSLVCERFGRCPYFIIFDSETGKFEAISNLGEQMQSGAGPKAAGIVISKDAKVLLTGKVGDKAENALRKAGIRIVDGLSGSEVVRDTIDDYLKKSAE
jgi:predicted Fe-Mo cluster-binding NifX family protein